MSKTFRIEILTCNSTVVLPRHLSNVKNFQPKSKFHGKLPVSLARNIPCNLLRQHAVLIDIQIFRDVTRPFNLLRTSDAYMRQQTNHHWFRLWLVAWPAPSHYLNQCWNIVNETLGNKLQWNFIRNSNIFIQENALENVVGETAAILSRPQCVYIFIYSYIFIYVPYIQLHCDYYRLI